MQVGTEMQSQTPEKRSKSDSAVLTLELQAKTSRIHSQLDVSNQVSCSWVLHSFQELCERQGLSGLSQGQVVCHVRLSADAADEAFRSTQGSDSTVICFF